MTEIEPFNADGWFTVVSKSDPARRYKVTLPGYSQSYPEGKCNCQAWEKSAKGSRLGVCKHIYIALEAAEDMASEEAMVADLYEREEAREFMLTSSIEHNVNFAADVMADTAAEFDPEPYDNQTDYADGWH